MNHDKHRAFSLLELLVVIALIILVITIVMVAVSRFQKSARNMQCLSNMKQLMMAHAGYSHDNNGHFCSADTGYQYYDYLDPDSDDYGAWWVKTTVPNGGYLNGRETLAALQEGKLWDYIGDARIYRSPQDYTDHIRSYAISGFLGHGESADWGGPESTIVGSMSRIFQPSTTIAMVPENDTRGHNINSWGIDIPSNSIWVDRPAIFQEKHLNISFSDGHVERYEFAGTSSNQSLGTIQEVMTAPGQYYNVYFPGPDYDWFKKRILPRIDY